MRYVTPAITTMYSQMVFASIYATSPSGAPEGSSGTGAASAPRPDASTVQRMMEKPLETVFSTGTQCMAQLSATARATTPSTARLCFATGTTMAMNMP